MFLLQAVTSCYKKIVTQFLLQCVSICISTVSQIFKMVFHNGDTNIPVHHVVICVIYFQIKTAFLVKKIPLVESETHFSRETVKV